MQLTKVMLLVLVVKIIINKAGSKLFIDYLFWDVYLPQ